MYFRLSILLNYHFKQYIINKFKKLIKGFSTESFVADFSHFLFKSEVVRHLATQVVSSFSGDNNLVSYHLWLRGNYAKTLKASKLFYPRL